MKDMYVMIEMEAKVNGFWGEYKMSPRGFNVEDSESVEAMINMIMKMIGTSVSEAVYVTFGNDRSIDLGMGVSYGRLLVHIWSRSEAVFWARDNSVMEVVEVSAGKPNKRQVRKLVNEMIKRHKAQMEAEAAREYW